MATAEQSLYRSFTDQALHYFMRPHTVAPESRIASAAGWRGSVMGERSDEWLTVLGDEEIQELSDAADALLAGQVPLREVTRESFPLQHLEGRLQSWQKEIASGRGFVVLRGLPVTSWGEEKSSYVFWGIGHHLGLPGAQNANEELLGHVRNYGESGAALVRQYRTTENINFHCDAADVVGLLCLQDAKAGGQSRIVSSVAVFNHLLEEQPALAARLFEPFALDRRNEHAEGEPGWFPIQPCCYGEDGVLRSFYHSEYFRSAERHADVTLDALSRELLTAYDKICSDPAMHLDMWLEPGDIQLISNHSIVHARTEYTDWPEADRKRHLLRLWLSI